MPKEAGRPKARPSASGWGREVFPHVLGEGILVEEPLVASLLLVVRPGVLVASLLLVVRPGARQGPLVASLLLVVRPGKARSPYYRHCS